MSQLRNIKALYQKCAGGLKWLFPSEFSQSNFMGKNGSNACTLIALNICHFFLRGKLSTLSAFETFPGAWLLPIASSIKVGNFLYEKEGHRSKCLSVEEAMEILGSNFPIEADASLPVKFENEHGPSTVSFQLHLISSKNTRQAYVLTMDGVSVSLLVLDNNDIVVIDTHCHVWQNVVYGTQVLCFPSSALSELCLEIRRLFSSSDKYGNLQRIRLK